MRRAWLLGAAAALLGAGLTVAQEVQPPAAPAPPPPDAAPAPPQGAALGVPADEAPPEEAAPAPRVERPPVAEADEADAPPPEPPPPLKRPRFGSAILQGVDKITAETFRFEAKVGEPVRYKGVILTVHACEGSAADEPVPNSFAHLEIVSQPRVPPGRSAPAPRTAFRGWMFADSPSLHPFESPSYDLWLIACKAAAPDTAPTRT